MHELYVTEQLVQIAVDAAKRDKMDRIDKINVVIGDLTGIIDDSVLFYFDILVKETLAAGAQLQIRRVPATWLCSLCDREYNQATSGLNCPICGRMGEYSGKGREFYVESIECEER